MDNMTVNIKSPNHQPNQINKFSTIKDDEALNTNPLAYTENSKTDEVTISQEAKDKQLEEVNSTALQKILKTDESEESEEKEDPLDQMIEELEEQIAELAQEIAQLNTNDESSQEKAKILNAELAGLQAQLIELVSQKLGS
jgi:predicted ribosome quality control (RQC) complex YloA/Tae2 family protein